MPPIIPQIIGLLAVAAFLLSYQLKKRSQIIAMNVTSRILYILQYLLLGAYAGAVLDVFGALSSVIAGKKHLPFIQKHTKLCFWVINALIIITGLVITFISKNPLDLLPLAGVLLHTSAFWITDEKIIRRVSLIGSPFWMTYNLITGAYFCAAGDVLTMVSIVTAMIKYQDFKKK